VKRICSTAGKKNDSREREDGVEGKVKFVNQRTQNGRRFQNGRGKKPGKNIH